MSNTPTSPRPSRPAAKSGRKPASAQKPATRKRKKKTGRKRAWLWWTIGVVAAILLIAGGIAAKIMLNRADKEAMIFVPRGCTAEMLGDSITKYLGKGYADDVMLLLKTKGVNVADLVGAYKIEKGMPSAKAAWRISQHRQSEVPLVLNHLRTPEQVAQVIASRSVNSPDEVLKLLQDPTFLSKYGLTPEQAQSLTMENKYNIMYGWSADKILDKVASEYVGLWNEERRGKAHALGLTPEQVMVIASITDEESNKADEKGKIGRLYINRIDKGMKLQSDPTVRYALGDFTIKRVKGDMLKIDSPYNTYKYAGLPPGPIATTSRTTVDAILNSEPSDYLFMCAKEDFSGYHNFASTYEQHQQNARRYQQELDRKGIQ